MKKENIKILVLLHILLAVFSLSSVFTKMASSQEFMSFWFILYYGLVILILGIYAIAWQQIIKRIPLTSAYANRAITVVWGIIWGMLIFSEEIKPGKIIGALIVITGVLLYVRADAKIQDENASDDTNEIEKIVKTVESEVENE